MLYNMDGTTEVAPTTLLYSYLATGDCRPSPLGYERVRVLSSEVASVAALCPNDTCTGCYLVNPKQPLTGMVPLQGGAVGVQPLPDCLDFGPGFAGCLWLSMHHAVEEVSVMVLLCGGCTSYSLGNASYNVIETDDHIFLGCSTCSANTTANQTLPTACDAALPRTLGACTVSNGHSACLSAYGCDITTLDLGHLLSWVVPTGCLVLALIPAVIYRRACTRRAVAVGRRVVAACVAAWRGVVAAVCLLAMLLKVWVLYVTRPVGRRCYSGDVHWSLLLSSLAQVFGLSCLTITPSPSTRHLHCKSMYVPVSHTRTHSPAPHTPAAITDRQVAHVVAFVLVDPLGLFDSNTLLLLGFSPNYLDLSLYSDAMQAWRQVALYSFVAAAGLTSAVCLLRVFFHTHKLIVRWVLFVGVLAPVFSYAVYPILISFKYLIKVVPSANPYLQAHPDTVSSLETITGDGLASVAVCVLNPAS